MAPGIDSVGWAWAYVNGITVVECYALWGLHGNAAGPMRNDQMAQKADALIAITNGSKGTADMIRKANLRGLKVYVKNIGDYPL